MYRLLQRFHPTSLFGLLLGAFLLPSLTGCNGGLSPGSSVLESEKVSLQATINYFQSLGPTMTAQVSVQINQISTLQSDLNRSRMDVATLTTRLNTMGRGGTDTTTGQPTPFNPTPAVGLAALPTNPPSSDGGGFSSVSTPTPYIAATPLPGTPLPAGVNLPTPGPVRSTSGMTLESLTTSRATDDSSGCASDPANTFRSSDKQILVVVVVRNFRANTKFTAKWAGNNFTREDDWTTPQGGVKTCVHFFIEPTTLRMAAGTYTVSIAAAEASGASIETGPLQFSVVQ